VSDIRCGRIVWVELLDPQGRNPKVRPAVVVTPTHEIVPEGDVQVVAITGVTDAAPPEECFPLPWLATGHPKTGLSKPSVAVASWQAVVPTGKIQRSKGVVPTPQLLKLLSRLAARVANPPAPPPARLPPPPKLP